MATAKKQVSGTNTPKDKNAAAGAKNGSAAAVNVKASSKKTKKAEEKSRAFVSRRVWPD